MERVFQLFENSVEKLLVYSRTLRDYFSLTYYNKIVIWTNLGFSLYLAWDSNLHPPDYCLVHSSNARRQYSYIYIWRLSCY